MHQKEREQIDSERMKNTINSTGNLIGKRTIRPKRARQSKCNDCIGTHTHHTHKDLHANTSAHV